MKPRGLVQSRPPTRSRRIYVVVAVWIIALFVLFAIFFGPTLLANINQGGQPSQDQLNRAFTATARAAAANPVLAENTLQGTTDWQIAPANESTFQIQAYAGATSVAPGNSITFYVSTQDSGNYTIDIYRMGWYDGAGARLMTVMPNNAGVNQGYYGVNTQKLVCSETACPPPDKTTGLFQLKWQPSYKLTIPTDWVSGLYFAKFIDAKGFQTYTPFDVLGNTKSTYILMTPDTTAEAYNLWGGASLYEEDDADVPQYKGIPVSKGAGVQQVSFDRPYADGDGSGLALVYELPTIRWLERQGYNVSYISSTDLDQHPDQLLQHKALLSIGHDEYWTKAMRDGVEAARAHGVGLAFLGANTAYWQMRFAPGSNDRVMTCYKVQTGNNDLNRDPEYGKDNSIVTAQWRDPVVNRPENEMTGVMFSELTHKQAGFAWTVDPHAQSPLLAHTGLQSGKSYGCGLVGYEWDRVFDQPSDDPTYKAATPKNLQVLSTSQTEINDSGVTGPDHSNSAYYIAPSGALVFAAGSIYWGSSLDDYRATSTQLYYRNQLAAACQGSADNSHGVPEMQKLMANVMSALIVTHPAGHL